MHIHQDRHESFPITAICGHVLVDTVESIGGSGGALKNDCLSDLRHYFRREQKSIQAFSRPGLSVSRNLASRSRHSAGVPKMANLPFILIHGVN
jgi:hypothetical protein